MSEKEFLSWLKGFIQGREPLLDSHTTGFEILSIIKNQLGKITKDETIESEFFSKPSNT